MQKLKTGTTTVGIICKDGVVLAAEKKATLGYLVASKDDVKIVQVMPHIGMTQAGAVGDIQALVRYLKAEAALYELREGRKISVNAAATLLANIMYGGRWFPYLVQIILAGYDDKGPQLFILHPDGSKLEEKKFFSTGSGSPMAFGVLEVLYKDGITIEEGKQIAVKAVKAAVERDIASGGKGIDVAVIDKNGFRMLSEEEIQKMLKAN
ncbi:MAG: archaeal proteasome endopeptidase complex subunit beta [Candidatus Aenigmarchaeota archaeon]|nr:archaeal proteasome endopeptidase complex subunit beta [Candidatus Aenigmarchaeota archaeon]MBU5689195.1 archaeal proteasome endopeptidase complex subunit beta [Candidatus Aenigmarchaeota archaeon]